MIRDLVNSYESNMIKWKNNYLYENMSAKFYAYDPIYKIKFPIGYSIGVSESHD